MSVQSVTTTQADLEATAELPVLDVAAFESKAQDAFARTDTWVAPSPVPAKPPEALAVQQRTRLEEDLRSLSANLREFEERLASKGERLNVLERELQTARRERDAAEQRATAFAQELTQLRAELDGSRTRCTELSRSLEVHEDSARAAQARDSALIADLAVRDHSLASARQQIDEMRAQVAAQLEALQSQEGRRGVFELLLRGLDSEVGRGEARIVELQRELAAQSAHVSASSGQVSAGEQRIDALEGELKALTAALAKRNEEVGAHIHANEELRERIRTLTAANAAHLERIRVIEAAASSAAQAHAEALIAATNVQRELEEANGSQRRRIDGLESELSEARAAGEAGASALRAAEARHAERIAQLSAAEARAEELRTKAGSHEQSLRDLEEELRASAERAATNDADLRAAEDTINRLESELRTAHARLEQFTRSDEEWRTTMDAARQSLDERDSLIRRLESEAAHSTALLDNIQHSIRFFEQPAPSANELTPEGATRLLIRTEDDAEVTHVLGRKTSIGRTPDNDVQIDTKFVSRHHAVVLSGPSHTVIEDLNSTNGVLVNGRRITRQTLKDGDQVIVGRTPFRFQVSPPGERRVS